MRSILFTSPLSTRRASLSALAATIALAGVASAQIGNSYGFSQAVGSYAPITGGTQVAVATGTSGAASLDDNIYNVALPFSFNFDGNAYTAINVSTNGFVTFGATAPTGSTYIPLSSTLGYAGAVSPFGRDLQAGFTCSADRTAASDQLDNVSSLGPIQVGDLLVGTGIPAGTTVVAITGNTITMSAAATTTGVAGVVTAVGPWAEIRTETLGSAPNQTFVVQWSGFKRFGTVLTTVKDMTLNFQVRLHESSGLIEVVYGDCTPGTTTLTTVNQVGLRGATNSFPTNVLPRLSTKGVNDNWLNSVGGISNTSGMPFNNVAPANVIPNGLTYTWIPGVAATSVSYGTGCYNIAQESFYELQPTAAGGSAAFSNTSYSLAFTGAGYVVTAGTASIVTPGAGAVALVLGDDTDTDTPALSAPFPYVNGATTALRVCSNGFVSAAAGNGTAFTPSALTMLNAPQTGWWIHHDLNPAAAGSGQVLFEEVGGVAYVTFDGVYNFSGSSAADANTFQYQFDLATGNVNMVIDTLSANGNGWLVGYSTGGVSLDPGSITLATAVPFVTSPDQLALALSASQRPVLGSTVVYTTSNIPSGALATFQLLSLVAVNPGNDLGSIGAPGCLELIDSSNSAVNLTVGSPATFSLAIPSNPALVGLPINLQSAALYPPANALGLLTSNAIGSTVGDV